MKTIRIDFCDFWPGFQKDDNRIYNLLKTRYAVELHDRPDFVIYSSFGDHHRLHSCTRILFTGESHRPDFTTCDYAFTCHYLDDARHLRWPLLLYTSRTSCSETAIMSTRSWPPRLTSALSSPATRVAREPPANETPSFNVSVATRRWMPAAARSTTSGTGCRGDRGARSSS